MLPRASLCIHWLNTTRFWGRHMSHQHQRIASLRKQRKLERIASDRGALARFTATTNQPCDRLNQLLHAEPGTREDSA